MALRVPKHVIIHGESGTGKTWLYKKVLGDKGYHYEVANMGLCAGLGSIAEVLRAGVCREVVTSVDNQRSIDGSMSGDTDKALRKAGAARRVALALPHFHAIALTVAKGRLIAVVPQQFAEAVAIPLKLSIYRPPIDIPVPEIAMYWHKRDDRNPAHIWLRGEIAAAMKPYQADGI